MSSTINPWFMLFSGTVNNQCYAPLHWEVHIYTSWVILCAIYWTKVTRVQESIGHIPKGENHIFLVWRKIPNLFKSDTPRFSVPTWELARYIDPKMNAAGTMFWIFSDTPSRASQETHIDRAQQLLFFLRPCPRISITWVHFLFHIYACFALYTQQRSH